MAHHVESIIIVHDMMKNQIGGSIWRKTTRTRMIVRYPYDVVLVLVIIFVAQRKFVKRQHNLNCFNVIPCSKSILQEVTQRWFYASKPSGKF